MYINFMLILLFNKLTGSSPNTYGPNATKSIRRSDGIVSDWTISRA